MSTMDSIQLSQSAGAFNASHSFRHNDTFYSYDDLPELWEEPDVAPQIPSATGYPLDVPPPQKLLPKVKKATIHRGVIPRGGLRIRPSLEPFRLPSDVFKPRIISDGNGRAHVPQIAGAGLLDLRTVVPDSPEGLSNSGFLDENAANNNDGTSADNGSSQNFNELSAHIPFSEHIGFSTPPSQNAPKSEESTPSISSPPTLAESLTATHGLYPQSHRPMEAADGISNATSRASSSSLDAQELPVMNNEETRKKTLMAKLKTNLTENMTAPSHIRTTRGPGRPRKQKPIEDTQVAPAPISIPKSPPRPPSSSGSSSSGQTLLQDFFVPAAPEASSSPKSATDSPAKTIVKVEPVETQPDILPSTPSTAPETEAQSKRPSEEPAPGAHKKSRQNKRRKTGDSIELPSMNTRSRLQEVDDAAANDDFCSTCGGVGRFLCCEGCPKSFHFSCVDPPLDENSLPEGEWFCKECTARRSPPKPYKRGIFSQLLYQLDTRNPVLFVLPKKIKQRFEGVTQTDFGDYVDSDMRGAFKSTRSGFVEEDPYKLTDKNGNPIFCYKCKKSSLSGGPIARCEYCSLNWHLDCLNPPLPTVKTVGTKWKCPNHADHAFKKKRRPKTAKVVDSTLRRGFRNDGNIEVLLSSDEDEMEFDSRDIPIHNSYDTLSGVTAPVPQHILKPHVQNGVIYRIPERGVKLDFIQRVHEMNEEAYQDTRNSDILLALDVLANRDQDSKEAVRNLCYLKSEGSSDVVTAQARQNIETLIEAALAGPATDTDSRDKKPSSESRAPSVDISTPMRSSRRASQIAANKILAVAEEGRYNTRRGSSRIASAVNDSAPPSSARGSRLRSSNSSTVSVIPENNSQEEDYISPEDRTHLLAIQKLMKLKGKDALMDFLLPRVE